MSAVAEAIAVAEVDSGSQREAGSVVEVDSGSEGEVSAVAEAGSVAKIDSGSEGEASAVSEVSAIAKADSVSVAEAGAVTEAVSVADIDQETGSTQVLANFNRGGDSIQKEMCGGFVTTDWINQQDLSVTQSIQYFVREQIESILKMSRGFPSPKEKEDTFRCFINTAFSLRTMCKVATDYWWQNVQQVSLQAPHEETLIKFVEYYFTLWVGYGRLSSLESVPADRISFTVEEPHLLGNEQYLVVTNFDIMSFYSAEIVWTVDARSFPKELSFLDISFEGVSLLKLLRSQMRYLFQKEHGDMNEMVFFLQNKMDDRPLTSL